MLCGHWVQVCHQNKVTKIYKHIKPITQYNISVRSRQCYKNYGFVDLWGSFVGRGDMYMKDGLHLSEKQYLRMDSISSRQWHG